MIDLVLYSVILLILLLDFKALLHPRLHSINITYLKYIIYYSRFVIILCAIIV